MSERRSLHRMGWLICHPLLVFLSFQYIIFGGSGPTRFKALAVLALLLLPLVLFVRSDPADSYRARTYCYSFGLAFLVAALWGAGLLMFVMALGNANWK